MEPSSFALFVPSALRALDATSRMLDAVASEPSDPRALLERRLIPDMFPFHRQIEIVTTGVAGTVARLAGQIDPAYCGRELSVFNRGLEQEFAPELPDIAALLASVASARGVVVALRAEQIVTEHAPIAVCKPGEARLFATSHSFVVEYVVPNLFFHVAIAYAILRAAGVALGKGDYMGQDPYEVEHAPLPPSAFRV
jgi:uncharacterized protein